MALLPAAACAEAASRAAAAACAAAGGAADAAGAAAAKAGKGGGLTQEGRSRGQSKHGELVNLVKFKFILDFFKLTIAWL